MLRRLVRWLVGTDRQIDFLQEQYDFISQRLDTYHEFLKEERDLLRRQREIDAEHRELTGARMSRIDYYLQGFANSTGVGIPRNGISDEEWNAGASDVDADDLVDMQYTIDDLIDMSMKPEVDSDGG